MMQTDTASHRAGSVMAALVAPYAPTLETRRYASLDGLRFLAALAVVFVHCNMLAAAHGWSQSKTYLLSFNLCVDFFFILSGFVIETAYGGRMSGPRDYGLFTRARLARIYPLHLLTVIVCIPMCVMAKDGVHFRAVADFLDLAYVAPNLLLVQSFDVIGRGSLNFASWSISAEMAMYLAFPATLAALRFLRPLGLIILAVVIFALIAALRSTPWTLGTDNFGVLRALPGFLAGLAISACVRRIDAPAVSARHTALIVVLIAFAMLCAIDANLIMLALPLAVAIPALAERNGKPGFLGGKTMTALGDASYSIYMLHLPILFVLTDQLDRAVLAPETKSMLVYALAPPLTLAIALPMYRFFELPLRAFLSGRRVSFAGPAKAAKSAVARAAL